MGLNSNKMSKDFFVLINLQKAKNLFLVPRPRLIVRPIPLDQVE